MKKKIQYFLLILSLLLTTTVSTFAQCENEPSDSVELKILSWNIYMLPRFLVHSGQLNRAKEIVESLKNENADVIVFEEAFDRKAREIIRTGLKNQFPYESGDPAKNSIFKINSGVWVISKVPITVIKQIYFKESAGCDKFACKGAVLLKAQKNNSCFQIVATHLQSDLKKKEVQLIRKAQLTQINKELLEPFAQTKVPQFVVGDMNTIQKNLFEYNQMIDILNVKQCQFEGEINYSYDRDKNDIIFKSRDKPQLIDYIFFNEKDKNTLEGKMLVKVFQKKWNTQHVDLSDHFAVLGTFMLRQY